MNSRTLSIIQFCHYPVCSEAGARRSLEGLGSRAGRRDLPRRRIRGRVRCRGCPRQSPRLIRKTLPDALVIDLTRMPSAGTGTVRSLFARRKYTRHIPIVFVDGARKRWSESADSYPTQRSLRENVSAPPFTAHASKHLPNPVFAPSVMELYGSRTRAQKLGIKEGTTVGLFDAAARLCGGSGRVAAERRSRRRSRHRSSSHFVVCPRSPRL